MKFKMFITAALAVFSFFSSAEAVETIYLKTEFQDILPKFIVKKDGTLSGISYDLIKMIEGHGGVRFIYNTNVVPLIRASQNIERGITDVQVGIQKTPQREKAMVFGEPLYRVRTVALVRSDDKNHIASLRDLRALGREHGLILTVWGTGIAQVLEDTGGLYVDDGAKSAETGIMKLIEGKGRIFIYHNLSTFYIINDSAFHGKVRVVDIDYENNKFLENTYQYIAFSKKVKPKTIAFINGIIREKRINGELDRVTSKYLK